jgi:hypothetical protein
VDAANGTQETVKAVKVIRPPDERDSQVPQFTPRQVAADNRPIVAGEALGPGQRLIANFAGLFVSGSRVEVAWRGQLTGLVVQIRSNWPSREFVGGKIRDINNRASALGQKIGALLTGVPDQWTSGLAGLVQDLIATGMNSSNKDFQNYALAADTFLRDDVAGWNSGNESGEIKPLQRLAITQLIDFARRAGAKGHAFETLDLAFQDLQYLRDAGLLDPAAEDWTRKLAGQVRDLVAIGERSRNAGFRNAARAADTHLQSTVAGWNSDGESGTVSEEQRGVIDDLINAAQAAGENGPAVETVFNAFHDIRLLTLEQRKMLLDYFNQCLNSGDFYLQDITKTLSLLMGTRLRDVANRNGIRGAALSDIRLGTLPPKYANDLTPLTSDVVVAFGWLTGADKDSPLTSSKPLYTWSQADGTYRRSLSPNATTVADIFAAGSENTIDPQLKADIAASLSKGDLSVSDLVGNGRRTKRKAVTDLIHSDDANLGRLAKEFLPSFGKAKVRTDRQGERRWTAAERKAITDLLAGWNRSDDADLRRLAQKYWSSFRKVKPGKVRKDWQVERMGKIFTADMTSASASGIEVDPHFSFKEPGNLSPLGLAINHIRLARTSNEAWLAVRDAVRTMRDAYQEDWTPRLSSQVRAFIAHVRDAGNVELTQLADSTRTQLNDLQGLAGHITGDERNLVIGLYNAARRAGVADTPSGLMSDVNVAFNSELHGKAVAVDGSLPVRKPQPRTDAAREVTVSLLDLFAESGASLPPDASRGGTGASNLRFDYRMLRRFVKVMRSSQDDNVSTLAERIYDAMPRRRPAPGSLEDRVIAERIWDLLIADQNSHVSLTRKGVANQMVVRPDRSTIGELLQESFLITGLKETPALVIQKIFTYAAPHGWLKGVGVFSWAKFFPVIPISAKQSYLEMSYRRNVKPGGLAPDNPDDASVLLPVHPDDVTGQRRFTRGYRLAMVKIPNSPDRPYLIPGPIEVKSTHQIQVNFGGGIAISPDNLMRLTNIVAAWFGHPPIAPEHVPVVGEMFEGFASLAFSIRKLRYSHNDGGNDGRSIFDAMAGSEELALAMEGMTTRGTTDYAGEGKDPEYVMGADGMPEYMPDYAGNTGRHVLARVYKPWGPDIRWFIGRAKREAWRKANTIYNELPGNVSVGKRPVLDRWDLSIHAYAGFNFAPLDPIPGLHYVPLLIPFVLATAERGEVIKLKTDHRSYMKPIPGTSWLARQAMGATGMATGSKRTGKEYEDIFTAANLPRWRAYLDYVDRKAGAIGGELGAQYRAAGQLLRTLLPDATGGYTPLTPEQQTDLMKLVRNEIKGQDVVIPKRGQGVVRRLRKPPPRQRQEEEILRSVKGWANDLIYFAIENLMIYDLRVHSPSQPPLPAASPPSPQL